MVFHILGNRTMYVPEEQVRIHFLCSFELGAMRGAFETCKYSMMDDDLFLFLMIIEKMDVSGFLNNGAGLTSQIPWTLGYQRFTGAAMKHRSKDHVLPLLWQ